VELAIGGQAVDADVVVHFRRGGNRTLGFHAQQDSHDQWLTATQINISELKKDTEMKSARKESQSAKLEAKNADFSHNAKELEAIKRVRGDMGLTNVEIMIPFVRTLEMAKQVDTILKENGLARGENGLKVNMMAELPSNVFLADEFLEYFDGFSIGSNDLTQLTLGLDRDSGLVAQYFDERNPAVMKGLETLIKAAKAKGKYVGICGQGPSDHPDLAKWLMEQGIDSVSLNPDSVVPTYMFLGEK